MRKKGREMQTASRADGIVNEAIAAPDVAR